jgi:hypothetical protein
LRDLCQQLLSEKLFYVLYDDHDAEEYTHAELRKYRVESGEGAEGQAPASVAMAAPFLLATGDLTDPEELESRAKQIVGGAQHYHEGTLLVKRAEMLKRMELASIFDPIAVMGSLPTERDIDSLKLFRFSRKPGYAALLPKLKGEQPQYISKVKPIKPDKERRDSEGKDTFDFLAWWRSHMADLPSWAAFLRALLCNAPS